MQIYNTIGIMSGTSLDGLDIVYVKIYFDNVWKHDILSAKTYSYNKKWRIKLANAKELSALELINLNSDYGIFIGDKINAFINENNINKDKIDLISSHGHTIFHQPEKGFTYQIGCGAQISTVTKIKTICDFRSLDVAHGGQGAPLVPIGDLHLFNEYEYCLNLGGIANISYNENGNRIAADIDFANITSNTLAKKLGFQMDENGHIAQSGNINQPLLNELGKNTFYKKKFPKSLAIEDYNRWYEPIINGHDISIEDKLHTAGFQMCQNITNLINTKINHRVLVTGGGAYNSFWIKTMKKMGVNIILPSQLIIEYKEALIFAFLGVLKIRNQVNTLSSVTGASKDLVSGIIYDSKNF